MNKHVLSRFYQASALLPLLVSSALFAAPAEVGVVTTNPTKVQLVPCYAKDLPDRLLCGTVQQPLNIKAVKDAENQTISIHFAIIPAIKPLYPTEAVLAFAGGPGQSAFDAAAVFAQALRYARENRDILLVDQRGTGKSGLLQCDGMDLVSQFAFDESTADIVALAKTDTLACKEKLQVDLNHYTTVAAASDFEAVRQALGYQKLHLYGGSYGTRMAQEYMRQYPAAVVTATLDGVVPFNQSLGALGAASDASVAALYAYCEASETCHQQFPRARQQLQQLIQQLDAAPVSTRVRHPRTFALIDLTLTRAKLQQAIRFALYSNNSRALLPYTIEQALAGDYSPLVGLMLSQDIVQQLSVGVNFAVVCAEDVPFWTAESRAEFAKSYLGRTWMQSAEASCAVWQTPAVDVAYTQPLQTATPVLLLSGGLDPVTPPAWAELAMSQMPNARHLVAPHATHIVASQSCAPKLISQFINQQSAANLDASCLNQELRKPFFTNANGVASLTAEQE
ncbi:TAP domain-containing protein [Alishewanella agri BL06]|uniref:TAP domain-containing protein n=1 Tax=Alishewanella agri BL06 TaxID=1195246 RepID=I9DQY7_9ALTE|nr:MULTISPECIES: alpha/beta hydrolase [Alishewanella]EIW88445.1 TAP domain-containing protein [Alishewanella agri BL06]KRS20510.1 alpha/beta hydrolase [Alishewanella sp. WH16-1]